MRVWAVPRVFREQKALLKSYSHLGSGRLARTFKWFKFSEAFVTNAEFGFGDWLVPCSSWLQLRAASPRAQSWYVYYCSPSSYWDQNAIRSRWLDLQVMATEVSDHGAWHSGDQWTGFIHVLTNEQASYTCWPMNRLHTRVDQWTGFMLTNEQASYTCWPMNRLHVD